MPTPPISKERRIRMKEAIEAALRDGYNPVRKRLGGRGSSVLEAERRLKKAGYNENRNSLQKFIYMEEKRKARGEENFLPDWSLFSHPSVVVTPQTPSGKVYRWLLTAAQDDTDLHMGFWTNLHAYANYLGAAVVVGGMTYQQIRHTDRHTLTNTYRKSLHPYLRFDPLECGPVVFAADMNILPTAARPLSGLHPYARGVDTVFPHTKIAYDTVPQQGAYVPSVMTTGACTMPNYIDKKAGKKARFHHVFGATLVEVDTQGRAWCRQIHAAEDGSFQDLDAVVREGKVSRGHRVTAIIWGDLHIPYVPEHIEAALWDTKESSMINSLRPRFQFFHDLMDFRMWSRHVDGDAFHRAQQYFRGETSVETQVQQGVDFLERSRRDETVSVVIESNHDKRLYEWAKRNPDRMDVENIIYWHRLNLAYYEAQRDGVESFNLVRWALKEKHPQNLDGIEFVPEGESFRICHDVGGIECGMHGHLGPNGARAANTHSLNRMGSRFIRGHEHSPSIHDGGMTVGMTGDLDQEYNKGPSSWKRAHGVVYPNGKRTLVTQTPDGAWRAAG